MNKQPLLTGHTNHGPSALIREMKYSVVKIRIKRTVKQLDARKRSTFLCVELEWLLIKVFFLDD